MSLSDKSAYPAQPIITRPGVGDLTNYQGGMTLLEHYAGLAMQGICANPDPQQCSMSPKQIAEGALLIARDLIAELERPQ